MYTVVYWAFIPKILITSTLDAFDPEKHQRKLKRRNPLKNVLRIASFEKHKMKTIPWFLAFLVVRAYYEFQSGFASKHDLNLILKKQIHGFNFSLYTFHYSRFLSLVLLCV